MTSRAATPETAFVWIWLPGTEEPVVAGRLDQRGDRLVFGYGNSYRRRSEAVSIYEPELPLVGGAIEPRPGLDVAGCLLDAGPDSWGQRVILNRLLGPDTTDVADLTLLTYLLESGSDRSGALDFQASAESYAPRGSGAASLEDLERAAELLQAGERVPKELEAALMAGSSVGGARPKAVLRDGQRQLIAKFSSLTDTYQIVRAEFVAMRMAALCGLDAAQVELTSANGKDVLLVERFDRVPGTLQRRDFVSALTMLGLPEIPPRDASYAELALIVREHFTEPTATLRELFGRITFNILSGNTDDHARNHAAFWDGRALTLTPAYDICTYVRGGGEAVQAMIIGPPEDPYRYSQVAGCVERAWVYGLDAREAREIVERQLTTINERWDDVCDEARLAAGERAVLRRMFPHPFALEGF
jgi:serine/threonine-protein kinase HipA